jgi:hypothetical protein
MQVPTEEPTADTDRMTDKIQNFFTSDFLLASRSSVAKDATSLEPKK